ncbi:copper chaperone PCu(A)C [Azospirillum sp. ST 5-10]|uniref:copper chaperone PCu(A)C n=1 Tax=unclassified Azospirillum TaxID=2630922 RepID=UPI003F4A0D35
MSKHPILTTALALAVALPAAAWAEAARVGDVVVERAWARATLPAAPTGATYLTVRNVGAQPDRIVSLQTPAAGHATAHATTIDGGVARMQEAGPLALPPGGVIDMKPGGTHIMLMDLKEGLKPGRTFALSITFEKAGTVEVPVTVAGPGAMGPEREERP